MFNPELDTSPVDKKLEPCDCPFCLQGMMYPTDWEEIGRTHWDVELRCPNCDWRGDAVFNNDEIELFDDRLDEGTETLLANHRELMLENMSEWVENFGAALRAGAILPEDF